MREKGADVFHRSQIQQPFRRPEQAEFSRLRLRLSRLLDCNQQLRATASERKRETFERENKAEHSGDLLRRRAAIREGVRQQRGVMRIAGGDEALQPRGQAGRRGAIIMREPPHAVENFRRVLGAGFVRQEQNRVFAEFLRQARAVEIQNRIFRAFERRAGSRLRIERRFFDALLKHLLKRHALVAKLNHRALIFADPNVPRFLHRHMTERPFPHNRLHDRIRQQVIQPPEHVGTGEEFRRRLEIHQRPLNRAGGQIDLQRLKPVVDVLHEWRQRSVAHDADAISAEQLQAELRDIALFRRPVFFKAGDGGVLKIIRRRMRAVAQIG